jgi:hypothetical protein
MTLYELSEQDRQLQEMLYENGGELTPEMEEMLKENRENFSAKIEGYNHIIRENEGFAAACDAEIKRLQDKKKRAQNSVTFLKTHILNVMKLFEMQKIEGANGDCKVSRGARKSVVVDEDAVFIRLDIADKVAGLELPDYVTLEPKINKTVLGNRLKAGEEIADAELQENEFVTIR